MFLCASLSGRCHGGVNAGVRVGREASVRFTDGRVRFNPGFSYLLVEGNGFGCVCVCVCFSACVSICVCVYVSACLSIVFVCECVCLWNMYVYVRLVMSV